MRQYKIYTTGNKLNIIDQKTNDIYSALTTEALVRQLKNSEDGFKIYNVRDWNEDKVLKLVQLLKQDGTPYESVEDFIGNFNGGGTAPKYKVLSFIVNQSGTNPPVLTELENTIGEVSTTYVSGGDYLISSSGMFTANKTTPISIGFFDGGAGLPKYITGERLSNNQYQIMSFDESLNLTDGVLNNLFLEIRVYE